MLKRPKGATKFPRKRKKGNTTCEFSSLDGTDDKKIMEDIRVWDISTSKATGRVTAKRRILQNHSQVPGEPPTSKGPEKGEEIAHVEDTGNLADTEFSEIKKKSCPKKKRVKVSKENDSVSNCWFSLFSLSTTFLDEDGTMDYGVSSDISGQDAPSRRPG